jgi:hypothetical protein
MDGSPRIWLHQPKGDFTDHLVAEIAPSQSVVAQRQERECREQKADHILDLYNARAAVSDSVSISGLHHGLTKRLTKRRDDHRQ